MDVAGSSETIKSTRLHGVTPKTAIAFIVAAVRTEMSRIELAQEVVFTGGFKPSDCISRQLAMERSRFGLTASLPQDLNVCLKVGEVGR
jgi:hypothetical protein